MKLSKNGTGVHEKETAPATDSNRTLRTETNSVSELIADAAVGHRRYYRKTMTAGLGTEMLHLPLPVLYHTFSKQYIAHETKIFRISHNSSEIFIFLDSRVTSTPSVKMLRPQTKMLVLTFS